MATLPQSQAALDYIDANFPRLLEDVRNYLRVRTDAKTGEGIQEGAEATLSHLNRLGCTDAQIVPTSGSPVVFGTLPSKQQTDRTLILHYWYDTATINPGGGQDWKFPPFGAEIVDAPAADLPAEWGKVLINRGALNQKGPGISALLGIEALVRAGGDLPVNLIFVMEGEEEVGSPYLHEFTTKYESILRKAQAIWVPVARQSYLGGESMNIPLGIKGDILIELVCQGPSTDGRDMWCGHSSLVSSPPWRLVQALSSLIDSDDNVTIEGFYDDYRPPSAEEATEFRRAMATVDQDRARRILNVREFKRTKPFEELMLDFVWGPQFNINGLVSGWTQPGPEWGLPMKAVAKCDIRLAPDMEMDDILAKLRKHLDNHGFSDIELRVVAGYNWSKWSQDDLIIKAAVSAAKQMDISYDITPSSGSCNPLLYLGLPCLYSGPGRAGRVHCQDEYITVDGVHQLMKYAVVLLHEYARV